MPERKKLKKLMRHFWLAAVCVVLAGCASAKPSEPKGFTQEDRQKVDAILVPLVSASGICSGQPRCPIGLGVRPTRRIEIAVGPNPPNKFGLTITAGALGSLQPSELQAALAHELAHVQLGHLDSREARRQAEGSAGAAQKGDAVEALRRNRTYDRTEEFAADRYAVELLDRLPGGPGRGCQEMLLLLDRLDLEQLSPGWSNWLSTHPTPAARLQALQAECDKRP
jgi:peptidase M48-like protein